MSNSKNILYLISLMLLMLTGCEADTSIAPFPNEGEEPVEVRLHATTLGASVEVTRASGDTIPLPENMWRIGMLGGTYQNLSLNYDNTQTPNLSTANGSTIYYPLQTATMNIYAYAPFSEEAYNKEDNTIWVRSLFDEDNSSRNYYITDPIWAGDTIAKQDAVNGVISASLQFKHVMSRLEIYLVHNHEKTYETIAIGIDFDRVQYGKMSMETGEITTANTRSETYKRYPENTTLQLFENTPIPQYDYTVLPGSVLQKIYIYFKDMNGDSDTYEYDFTAEGNKPFPVFVAGKTNRMIINLGKIEGESQVNGLLENFVFEDENEEI